MAKNRLTGLTDGFLNSIEKRPLAYAAFFFMLGVYISSVFGALPFYVPLVLLIACAAIYVLTRIDKNVLLFTAVFFSALLSFSVRNAVSESDNIGKALLPVDGRKASVTALIDSVPEINAERGTTSVILKTQRVKAGKAEEKASGRVRLVIHRTLKQESLWLGQRVRVYGRIFIPKETRNPGEFDYRTYLLRRGIHAVISVDFDKNEDVEIIGDSGAGFLKKKAAVIRRKLLSVVETTMPGRPVEASVVQGMILGETDNIPSEVSRSFRDSGTFHILAVSGFNVGLVTAAIFFLLRLARLGRRPSALVGIGAVIFYCFIAGLSPSVVRATIMAVIFLAGIALERDSDLLNALGLSSIIVLLIDPMDLFDIGFQLSYAATYGIIYLTPKIQALPFLKKAPVWLTGAAGVMISAQLFVLPILAYYFYSISAVSFLANLFVAPLVWLVSVTGFFQACIGMVLPFIANILGFISGAAVSLLIKLTGFFSSLPLAVIRVEQPQVITIFIFYCLLFLSPKSAKFVKESPVYASSTLLVLILIFAYSMAHKAGRLDAGYLSLKKAQARYLKYGGGFTMLYITGTAGEYEIERIILPALYSSGVNKIDLLIASKDPGPIEKKIKCGKVITMEKGLDKNLSIKSGGSFEICVMKDYTVAGKYKSEPFQFSGKDLLYGVDRNRIEYSDVKGSEAKVVYTYGEGWKEKKFK